MVSEPMVVCGKVTKLKKFLSARLKKFISQMKRNPERGSGYTRVSESPTWRRSQDVEQLINITFLIGLI